MASTDIISQQILNVVRDVKIISETMRKDIGIANEKDRSIGILAEQFAECCHKTAQVQFTGSQNALRDFSNTIARVELARKGLYQRIYPISQSALIVPSQNVVPIGNALKKREEAFKRIALLPPPENDPNANQNSAIRIDANTQNGICVTETRNWMNTYHNELKKNLREYAYAQMEFAAKSLEQWSGFMERLAVLDFTHDTHDAITLLEEGRAYQQSLATKQDLQPAKGAKPLIKAN